MSSTVLGAGQRILGHCSRSSSRILRAPQVGNCLRRATILSTRSLGVAVGLRWGPAGELFERHLASPRREPVYPLVTGLPADAEQPAERRHADRAAAVLDDELHTLVHRTGLFPGHPPSYLSA